MPCCVEKGEGAMLIAGNWKMNGLMAQLSDLHGVIANLPSAGPEALLCVPSTMVAAAAARAEGTKLRIGGQDCHAKASGAHTGDVSAEMLADAGAHSVIVGHSERRADHGETDAMVKAKAEAAARAGLRAIVCVGETEAQRDAGTAWDTVMAQLSGSLPDETPATGLVVAYEPVWAIGTGRVPSDDDILEMHGNIHEWLATRHGGVTVLYGGSVKPSNAETILRLDGVDGALIGGASLKPEDFLAIVGAAP